MRTKTLSHLICATLVLFLGALPVLAAAQGVVNINSADASALSLLPRVGPTVAQRIVEHREQNGKFQKKEDLLLVRGIGEATFELMAPYVVTEGETTLKEKVRVPREPAAESTGSGQEG
jgi:competence ComEA-like helix-hairpin-helix protein